MYFMRYFMWCFGVNKMPIEVIREGANGGTYFSDIHSVIKSGTKNHGKKLISLKILTRSFIAQVIMMLV